MGKANVCLFILKLMWERDLQQLQKYLAMENVKKDKGQSEDQNNWLSGS
jgi:hypothetical protein